MGDILKAHAADFALEKAGRVRLFTLRNYEVTAGLLKGQKWPVGRAISSLYAVEANTFVDIEGALDGVSGLPRFTVWKRVKEN
jgi:hypothetical protein